MSAFDKDGNQTSGHHFPYERAKAGLVEVGVFGSEPGLPIGPILRNSHNGMRELRLYVRLPERPVSSDELAAAFESARKIAQQSIELGPHAQPDST